MQHVSASCTRTPIPNTPKITKNSNNFNKLNKNENKQVKQIIQKGTGLVLSGLLFCGTVAPSFADLNKFEAAAGGEFGIGSAQQYGEADLTGRDFSNQDLRRSNFTAADCRKCNFKNSLLQGAYFIKAVAYDTNFENADLSDVLFDRAVLNNANLRNAVFQRVVLTRSDLGGADIYGTDFTNALIDKTQQLALCKYADGVNPSTGIDTRKSLGCGSRRRFRESTPSNPDGPQVSESEKEGFTKTIPAYRQ
eukprot:TRINITY_DN324_c0_g1_i1.p1 TRINITY_DN324_c0_g1~~TRINITY_DN324_c0_g1_i1.p1  ORF type:complete len:250 (-),score=39.13 TRINITY_DN324_c0_g1_i1:245-994(-)